MPRRTKEEAEETRLRLLDAAEQVFREHGVSSSTLDQVALIAGTTRGAIQWHFRDKAGLFEAMMARVSTSLEDLVAQAIAAGPALPLTELVALFLEPLKGIAADPRAANVIAIASHMMEYTPELAAFRTSSAGTQAAVVQTFQQALRKGARQHGTPLTQPAALAAQGLCGSMFGLINNWVLEPQAFDLPKAGRAALQTQLRGLGFGDETLALYGLAARRKKA